jgi:PPK2 family polyphosphate:nucleotide phosphotransferase
VADSFRDLLRLDARKGGSAVTQPTRLPTDATPGFDKGKKKGRKAVAKLRPALLDLQERLYASGRGGAGTNNSVLLVLQGMDTSGKGGVIEHVTGLVNPQGLSITSFRQPDAEERQHDFLWRIRRHVPEPGQIAVFDRSYYEDVLIVRVHELAPRSTWAARYDSINNFEADLKERGVTVIKCFLHISPEEQRRRLLARLDDPTKFWKYNPSDVDERGYWAHYAAAYDDALNRCNTAAAPCYVIPADHKWYRDLAISNLLLEHLQEIDPAYPPADFDPDLEKSRLSAPTVVEASESTSRRGAKAARGGSEGSAGSRGLRRADRSQGKAAGKSVAKKATGKQATGKKATGKKATGKQATGKKATGSKPTGNKATDKRASRKTAARAGGGGGNRTLTASRSRGRSHGLRSRQPRSSPG